MTRPAPPSASDTARVTDVIRRALGKPVSRQELVAATGLCDRAIREAIHEAVIGGAPIVSSRAIGGYCWREDASAIDLEAKRLRSHAHRLLERASALEKARAEQQELFA